jgi:hypothetical protein
VFEMHERRAVLYRVALDSVPTGQSNIQRGLASLDKVLLERTTVHRAMYRDGLGWIDFVWGDEGRWPPNSKGHRKGERGLSHAIEARQRKDLLSFRQVKELLRKMVVAIAEGAERRRHESPPSMRVIIGKNGVEVHLVKRTGGNAWALTVFYDELVEAGALDAISGALQPTHYDPTPGCVAMGAASLAAGAIRHR